ncbi:MAG: hypothetical protein ACLVJ4_02780 [Mediterraneibacter sp.]
MPLPFIIGGLAIAAGIGGIGSGIHGAAKMKDASDTLDAAKSRHNKNLKMFEDQQEATNKQMDKLGEKELKILKSFKTFSDLIEKIQSRPEFKNIPTGGFTIPKYNKEKLEEVSIGAEILLGGIGGAAAGTAGGFAAAGATTSAVMALGTASTGTAISSLSGIAATNATLAALGGGALGSSTLAGGVALGTQVLGAATLVELLVGGLIFNVTGNSLSEKADKAWDEMKKAEAEINKICDYLKQLSTTAKKYLDILNSVDLVYEDEVKQLEYTIMKLGKRDWFEFTEKEQKTAENAVLLTGLLYSMCKVKLVKQAKKEGELNEINFDEITASENKAQEIMSEYKKAS